MARTEHYKKSQLRKVVNEHDRRQKNYKNNVDLARSKNNYTYGVSDPAECVQAVNKRVQEIMNGRNVQTQTSVATEWVITLPKELAGRDREFFDECGKFCHRFSTIVLRWNSCCAYRISALLVIGFRLQLFYHYKYFSIFFWLCCNS